jgi:RimJ/RimL family protein N-acetyltransferase
LGRPALLLHGERVRLRQWDVPEHVQAWRTWLADPEVARWLGGEQVEPTGLTLAIERIEDGALIGGVALWDLSEDRRAELVIAIGESDARGRGYGREAIALLVRHAFSALRLREVFLRVHADNRRAVRCYLACGFVKEGRMVHRRAGRPAPVVVLMSHRPAI